MVLGGSMVIQKTTSEPAGKTQNSEARLLMPHELTHRQNTVAIVNSVITKIFNPCKYWLVTIQRFCKTLNHSVPVLSIASFIVRLLFILSSFVRFSALFDYSVFDYSVYFSVLILELLSRYFPTLVHIQQPSCSQ
jgi:hypothetical protein